MLYAQDRATARTDGQCLSAHGRRVMVATPQRWQRPSPFLGTLEEARGDRGKAEAYYRKSLQIQPQQPVAANNLAYRMLVSGENVDVALTLAQKARQSMPNSPNTADTRARAYYHKGTYAFYARPTRGSSQDRTERRCNALSPGDKQESTANFRIRTMRSRLRLGCGGVLAPDSPIGK